MPLDCLALITVRLKAREKTMIAVWTGRLLGTMIDPLTWGAALAAIYFTKGRPWYARLGIAAALGVAIAITYSLVVRPNDPSNGTVAILSITATVLWASIFLGVSRVLAARRATSR